MTQMVKNWHAMRETWVPPLGQEGPLEKGMATHSSILAWRIPETEEPGGLQSIGSHRVDTIEPLNNNNLMLYNYLGDLFKHPKLNI